MGSRYGGLKQIDPVGPGGETLIDYSVFDAIRAGFGKLVFVIRKDIEQEFRTSVGSRFEDRIAVEYVCQELDHLPFGFSVPEGRTKPWGTTHAILSAAAVIQEPFAVINADDFYGAEGYRILAQHLTSGTADHAMVAFVLRKTLSRFGTVARGICNVSQDGFLQHVVELTDIKSNGGAISNIDAENNVTPLTGDELVSMNMWGLNPQIFEQLREYFHRFLERHGSEMKSECYLPSAINELLQNNFAQVKVLRSTDSWFGVTYREDRPFVLEGMSGLIRSGLYPEKLWP